MKTKCRRFAVAVGVAAAVSVPATSADEARPEHPVCPSYRINDQYPLRLCDTGEAVKALQAGLRIVAAELALDGYFGPNTHAAVLEFQRQRGLEIDGLVGPITWPAVTAGNVGGTDGDGNGRIDPYEAVFVPPAPMPPPPPGPCVSYRFNDQYPLRRCDTGDAVEVAQAFLTASSGHLAVDGYFGPDTHQATLIYQELLGLEVDALIGPITWRSLTDRFRCGADADGSGVIDPDEITSAPSDYVDTSAFLEACLRPI